MILFSSMQRRHVCVAITCATFGLLTYFTAVGLHTPQPTWNGADNSTLGFGGIFVLTENTHTWRVQGLQKAARLVGLDLTIPIQTPKTEEDVHNYLKGNKLGSHVDFVKATLNYIVLLQQFIDTGLETALFVEDDVDFSIMIKSQVAILADTLATSGSNTSDPLDPFGRADWDILWLGHFGMEFTEQTQISRYEDPFALPWKALTSPFNSYYQQQQAAESVNVGDSPQQQLARNVAPLSTYAWATTRSHAQWLLEEVTSTRVQQFDVGLHILCKGLRQRCIAPVPELMHHHKVSGSKSIGRAGIMASTEGLRWWQRIFRSREGLDWWRDATKHTYNIEWSARCNAAESGTRSGDKWQCLPKDEHSEV
jgi:hypothetical protein